MNRYMASASSRRTFVYIEGLFQQLDVEFDRGLSAERSAVTSALIGTFLDFYRHHEDAVPEYLKCALGDIKDVRGARFLSLLESVLSVWSGRANGVEDQESDRRLILLLQITALYTDQINSDMDAHNQYGNLVLTDQAMEQLSSLCHPFEEHGELSNSQLTPVHMVEQFIMGTHRRKQKQLLRSDEYAELIKNEIQRLKSGKLLSSYLLELRNLRLCRFVD